MLLAIINFIAGFLLGSLATLLIFIWLGRAVLKKQVNKAISSVKSSAKLKNTEGDAMMDKVRELTLEQLDLKGQLDQPQKNALHGKHKNSISSRIKELEEQKLDLLRKTLALGYDPMIGTIDENGEIQKMKLSEYMVEYGITEKETKAETAPAPKKENPFKVIEGGKGDQDPKEGEDGDNSNR